MDEYANPEDSNDNHEENGEVEYIVPNGLEVALATPFEELDGEALGLYEEEIVADKEARGAVY